MIASYFGYDLSWLPNHHGNSSSICALCTLKLKLEYAAHTHSHRSFIWNRIDWVNMKRDWNQNITCSFHHPHPSEINSFILKINTDKLASNDERTSAVLWLCNLAHPICLMTELRLFLWTNCSASAQLNSSLKLDSLDNIEKERVIIISS